MQEDKSKEKELYQHLPRWMRILQEIEKEMGEDDSKNISH